MKEKSDKAIIQGTWIPTRSNRSDLYPKNPRETVLVRLSNGCFALARFEEDDDDDGFNWNGNDGFGGSYTDAGRYNGEVTHWMGIPSPPGRRKFRTRAWFQAISWTE